MKKLSQLFFVLIASWGFSQCEITGNSSINVGEKNAYSINQDAAQCKECYRWTLDSKAMIVSDNRLNSIEINPINTGNATLSVQYLSHDGHVVKCSKDLHISLTETANASEKAKNGECDIDVTNYETRKISNDRLGFFSNSSKDFSYTWEVTYKNGQKQTSTDNAPQFNYSKENPIISVSVTIASKSCYKKFTKTYDDNFWRFF